MKGKLVIIGTGCGLFTNFSAPYPGLTKGNRTEEKTPQSNLVEHLNNMEGEDKDWHLGNSIFMESYKLFDCRSSQTKVNSRFCYKVHQALEEGSHIIIIVPDPNMVDKRLREQAIILSLPNSKLEG